MNLNYLYKNWAHIGGVSVLFWFWMLFFNSKAEIGSYQWLFWLVIPFYFIHQFEEYVYPGKFKEELNTIFSKQSAIDFPLNDKNAFIVNTVLGTWVLLPVVIILGEVSIWFPLIAVALTAFNALLHIGISIRFKSYKPGLLASIFLNLPLAIYILGGTVFDNLVTLPEMLIIVILGIFFHWLILIPVILNFMRNRGKNLAST